MVFGGLYGEEGTPFSGRKLEKLKAFLAKEGLTYDDTIEYTFVLADEEGEIAACGSASGSVLKCIAVSGDYQGEGLSATVVTALSNYMLRKGVEHVFLFTKPKNRQMFADLGFYKILETADVLFMENRKGGIENFVRELQAETEPAVERLRRETGREPVQGAVVANCNPFTLGHRYLIEEAKKNCDLLHLFILSEDRSFFSAKDRRQMVQAGTADLENVLLHRTSDYLISQATFPTYFIKDHAKAADANCELDVRIFGKCIARPLGITKRFAGTEPEDEVTNAYNEKMRSILPEYGVDFIEIPRLEVSEGGKPVSAGCVRRLLKEGNLREAEELIPPTTAQFIRNRMIPKPYC